MARSNRSGSATATKDEEKTAVPPVGEETVTAEGSHRSISNGDGTARQVPIVNANGEYPPRPEGWNEPK